MKKAVFTFLVAITALSAMFVGGVGFIGWAFLNSPGSQETREVIYEAAPGKSFMAIARDLEMAGVVQNAQYFNWYAAWTGRRAELKAGEYGFSTGMRPHEVLEILTSGRSLARPFTVSEGLNIFEIAAAFERQGFGQAKEFLQLARDPEVARSLVGPEARTLEGYLFPETYQITKFTTARELIAAMVRRFLTVYREIEALNPPMTRHELVTFASLIEKETGAPEERPIISSVFHNRLKKRMRLQTDPTIIYGIAMETGEIPKNIRRVDIQRPTAYNTYTIPGMPPGPIANPGRDSLLAVLKPANTDYLFFVSRNDGTHIFSRTYEEHNKAVRAYQLDPRAREGRSWRDLQNRNRSAN